MPVYEYAARGADGVAVRGAMAAEDETIVVASLRTRTLFVTSLRRAGTLGAPLGASLLRRRTPHRRALLVFFRSLATLVRAGVGLRRALAVAIARTTDAALREALRGVLADVEHGAGLAAALAARPHAFAAIDVAMIGAGEAGGILDDVLERLATVRERDAELRAKLRAALAYPATVLAGAAVLVVFLTVRVVPMFADLFAAFRIDPPPFTVALIALARALGSPLLWLTALPACAAAALAALGLRGERSALALDRVRLRLPLIGTLVSRSVTARVARLLATLVRAGIDLVAAIEAVTPVAGSPAFAAALHGVAAALRRGETLTAALGAARVFDPLALALVAAGEESGRVDEMLIAVAAAFERDVEAAIAALGATLEPLLIAFLGVVVGAIVFSVFLPLYSLIGSLSQ